MTKSPVKSRRRLATAPLFVVAALLLGSALLRLGDGAGRALALELGEAKIASGSPTEADPGLAAALDALREREQQLSEREATIEDRAQAVAVAEELVRANMKALAAAEERLTSLIIQVEDSAESDLVQLTTVYENMKPKEAALLFEKMSPDFASGFLGRMRPDAAAAILSGLKPEHAYAISVLLAGRNAAAAAAVASSN